MGRLGAKEHLLRGLEYLFSEKEEEWRLGLGEQKINLLPGAYTLG